MVYLNENDYRNYDILPCAALIFSYDEKFAVIYSNEVYKHTFGENVKIHQNDRKKFENAIIVSDTPQSVSVRIKNADGKYVYICMSMVRICDDKILALLKDDSENVIARQNLETECLRYITAIGGSEEIFFEYDYEKDVNTFFYLLKQNVKSKNIYDFLKTLQNNQYIFPTDKALIRKYKRIGINNEIKFEARIRLKGHLPFEWYRITVRPSNKKNIYVGSAVNINEMKLNEENLRNKALIDPLSKVYNRAAAVDKINERLEKLQVYEECSLIVIDLDNFKKINDTFGHLYGDAVVAMAAGSIKSIADKSDIIGRFGGDEFFIFTTKANRGELDKKLESIRLAIMKMRLDKNDQEDISCSIGVAVSCGGTAYNDLFAQADSALYKAKLNGKNRFEYFDGEYIEGHAIDYAQRDDENEIAGPIINQDITAVGLEIASKSRSAENAVSNLMRHIGVALDMDCIQIMQFDTLEDKVSLCYQWWKEHNGEYNLVLTEKKAGYYVHNDLMIFRDKFEKEKIFRYTPDFKNGFSKKFRAVFDAASFMNFVYSSNSQNEDIFYVVCYHCKDVNRIWTDNELNDMFEIMKIISVFMRSANVKSKREKQLEDMLDHSKFGLYSMEKLYEEASRIGRKSWKNGEKMAVVDFDIKGLHKFNHVYGRSEGNKIIDTFANYLCNADKNRIISCFIPGTDRFITIFRYDTSKNIKVLIEDGLNEFCKKMGNYKKYPLIMKAGLCFFEQGQEISEAIGEAYHIKRGINADKCICVTCNL